MNQQRGPGGTGDPMVQMDLFTGKILNSKCLWTFRKISKVDENNPVQGGMELGDRGISQTQVSGHFRDLKWPGIGRPMFKLPTAACKLK